MNNIKDNKVNDIFTLNLSEKQVAIYAKGLDSSIKLIAQNLLNSNNSILVLRNVLPQLMELNSELVSLDVIIDKTIAANKINYNVVVKNNIISKTPQPKEQTDV